MRRKSPCCARQLRKTRHPSAQRPAPHRHAAARHAAGRERGGRRNGLDRAGLVVGQHQAEQRRRRLANQSPPTPPYRRRQPRSTGKTAAPGAAERTASVLLHRSRRPEPSTWMASASASVPPDVNTSGSPAARQTGRPASPATPPASAAQHVRRHARKTDSHHVHRSHFKRLALASGRNGLILRWRRGDCTVIRRCSPTPSSGIARPTTRPATTSASIPRRKTGSGARAPPTDRGSGTCWRHQPAIDAARPATLFAASRVRTPSTAAIMSAMAIASTRRRHYQRPACRRHQPQPSFKQLLQVGLAQLLPVGDLRETYHRTRTSSVSALHRKDPPSPSRRSARAWRCTALFRRSLALAHLFLGDARHASSSSSASSQCIWSRSAAAGPDYRRTGCHTDRSRQLALLTGPYAIHRTRRYSHDGGVAWREHPPARRSSPPPGRCPPP